MTGDGSAKGRASADGDTGAWSVVPPVRGAIRRVDRWVADLRTDESRRRVALAVGVVAGLGLAWVHWLGLVAGGALVGLSRRSLTRAVLAGVSFGVLALVGTVLAPGSVGPGAVTALAPASYLAIVLGLVLPAWGALARVVV